MKARAAGAGRNILAREPPVEDSDLYPGASVVRPRKRRSAWPSIVSFVMLGFIWMAVWQPDMSGVFGEAARLAGLPLN